MSSLRRCSGIPSLRPCCRILRISLIKCRSDNPKRDLLAALRFIYVLALGSDPAIAPAVNVAYGFEVALSAIGWLVPLGYSAAHWARARAKDPVRSGGKTCRAQLRTPPLNLGAAILARSG